MSLFKRYIINTILGMTVIILLVMIGIEAFISFVNEARYIGEGSYGTGQALYFVLLNLPAVLYKLFPFIGLLGSLMGLGLLASRNELIVLRSAGVSIRQITMAVITAALLLITIVTVIGETIAPFAMFYAHSQKALETSGGQALRTTGGMWLRDGKRFIYIDKILSAEHLQDITEYQFDENNKLTNAFYAERADYKKGQWYLNNVHSSQLKEEAVTRDNFEKGIWRVVLKPSLLKVVATEPDEMSLLTLHRYIQQRTRQQIDTARFRLAYWQRLVQPFTAIVMMLLAIPFIFGSLRTSTMGARLMLGFGLSFAFYITHEFFGPVSLVYQFPVILAAILPTLLFALLAVFLLRRVR